MDTGHQYYLAVEPSTGDLYVSLPLRRQIWKVKAKGKSLLNNYEVFAGNGDTCADTGLDNSCGDGGLAASAQLSFPKGKIFS